MAATWQAAAGVESEPAKVRAAAVPAAAAPGLRPLRRLFADRRRQGLSTDTDEPQMPSIDDVLERARRRLSRLTPEEARSAWAGGALLVDTRTFEQRSRDGAIPGAHVIDRTVFEWRLDPESPSRIPEARDHDVRVIVICNEGYSSSLAAASLQDLGLVNATDVIGGFQAWKAAGLPVER